jgi:hypothetical protein
MRAKKPKVIKPKTNIEIINLIMSDPNRMAQLFVIDALGKACDACMKADLENLPECSYVNMHAWVMMGRKIREIMDREYGKGVVPNG